MFKKANIGIYLDNIVPAIGKDKAGDERRDLDVSFRIHPFSPELATELDPVVRGMLWSIGKVEASEKVASVGFDLKLSAQRIMFRAAPDATRVNIDVPYARIKGISARKHKGIAGWALTFHAVFPMPDEHALALLHNGYKRQHFLSFEATAPDLIDAMEQAPEAPPARRPPDKKSNGKEASDVH